MFFHCKTLNFNVMFVIKIDPGTMREGHWYVWCLGLIL
jgi:hypothetical protein